VASLWKMQVCAFSSCCCRSNHSSSRNSRSGSSYCLCCERGGDYSMPILNFSMRPPFVSPSWGRHHNIINSNSTELHIGERLASFKYKESPRCQPNLDAPVRLKFMLQYIYVFILCRLVQYFRRYNIIIHHFAAGGQWWKWLLNVFVAKAAAGCVGAGIVSGHLLVGLFFKGLSSTKQL